MRLIDADKLFNKFDTLPWYDNQDRDEIALQEVVDAPSVDAEIVTRCKDCRYYRWWSDGRAMHSCGFFNATVWDDDFCSSTEPKEDE